MANIDGGTLSFTADLNNEKLKSAIEETERRIKGLSDASVGGGELIDKAFDQASQAVQEASRNIEDAVRSQQGALQSLEAEYHELEQAQRQALSIGDTEGAKAIDERRQALEGELIARRELLDEARATEQQLSQEKSKHTELAKAQQETAKAQQSLRTRIRELREEMALLIDQGIDEQSEAYKELANELGRLQDIQGDIAQQANVLANDEAQYQGIIQGLGGLAGGFSAVTGAMALFGAENEDLQKVMTKVQGVMAITMGLQSVAQTLNKDSAFQLVTLNGLKTWWAGIVAKATTAEVAETIALQQNTTAQVGNATAQATQTASATAGTIANLGLAGAFRAVGLAIKSIPVFGWIIAGITALASAVSYFVSKANEAKEAQEAFTQALVEGAFKPIAKIKQLSTAYSELGDNIKDKEQFIQANQRAFEELGVSINSVLDAENLLKNNAESFIKAQIAKAKATIYAQQATEQVKELIKLEEEYKNAQSKAQAQKGKWFVWTDYNSVAQDLKKQIDRLGEEIEQGFKRAGEEEKNSINKMKQGGIQLIDEYSEGTIGAIEQAIAQKEQALKRLVPNSEDFKKQKAEIDALRKQLEDPNKRSERSSKAGEKKDPYLEMLNARRAKYEEFNKWVNSSDKTLAESARSEFAGLLREGASYLDYLQRQRTKLLSIAEGERTKAQNKQLSTLNSQIAQEAKGSVLEAFNNDLAVELGKAQSIIELLKIIQEKRKSLSNDGTDLDNSKRSSLDKAEQDALRKQQEQTQKLLEEYASHLDKKKKLEEAYNNDLALLEAQRLKATSEGERERIELAMQRRTLKYEQDSRGSGDEEYDSLLGEYQTYEQRKLDILEDFNRKRAKAQEHGNSELIEQLNKAQQDALSKLSLEMLKESPDWSRLFDNFEEIGTQELERLLAKFEEQSVTLGFELNPQDLEVVKSKVEHLKGELRERNPLKAISQGFKELKNAGNQTDKLKGLSSIMDGVGKSMGYVKSIGKDLQDTLSSLGIEGAEEIGHVIEAFDGLAQGAQNAIAGIMSGNPLQAISGIAQGVKSVVGYFAGANDRRAERAIKAHQANVERLSNAYRQLEWQIGKALGGDAYQHQEAQIRNLKRQQSELYGMINSERGKKKKDNGKINEWQERIQDINRQVVDIVDNMKKSLLEDDTKGIASQLGDALIGAFEQGKSAAEAWGDTVKSVMNKLVKNIIIQKVLQDPIDKVISKYTARWVGKDGTFHGFNRVLEDVQGLTTELNSLYPELEKSLNAVKSKLNLKEAGTDTTLTGAVKGVSEETASIVAGQLNAMRINQVEATSVLRQQLAQLSSIAHNTSYNRLLADIHRELKALNQGGKGDPLRAKGVTSF